MSISKLLQVISDFRASKIDYNRTEHPVEVKFKWRGGKIRHFPSIFRILSPFCIRNNSKQNCWTRISQEDFRKAIWGSTGCYKSGHFLSSPECVQFLQWHARAHTHPHTHTFIRQFSIWECSNTSGQSHSAMLNARSSQFHIQSYKLEGFWSFGIWQCAVWYRPRRFGERIAFNFKDLINRGPFKSWRWQRYALSDAASQTRSKQSPITQMWKPKNLRPIVLVD
jgi:hypothetical protein